jgi:phosphatidylserine decarboxylase
MRLDRAVLPFAGAFGGAALLAGAWSPWAALPFVLLVLFCLWFFRDPVRQPPDREGILVSPADGRVIRAEPGAISIFLNVFDVHVCRSPAAGRVERVEHIPGRFLAAFRDRASTENERAVLTVAGAPGPRVTFTLVAGLVARRIVCRVRVGETVALGRRIGLVRFGSRVDLDVPPEFDVVVRLGERVVAGESIVAERRRR